MLGTIKKIFLWTYARNTWQWDILCVLILAFIFLTPKGWFEGSERRANPLHQKGAVTTVIVGTEVIHNQEDKLRLSEHLRRLTGRADVEILGMRKLVDEKGNIIGYQVDIR